MLEMNLKLCRIDKENRAEKGWSDREANPGGLLIFNPILKKGALSGGVRILYDSTKETQDSGREQNMTKEAYLQALWNALILRVDRAEAERLVTYYERTLAEAGADGEARLVEQWGAPEALAARLCGVSDQRRGPDRRTRWTVGAVLCVLAAVSIYSGARQLSRWMDWGAQAVAEETAVDQVVIQAVLPDSGEAAAYEYAVTTREGTAVNGDALEPGREGSVYVVEEDAVQTP